MVWHHYTYVWGYTILNRETLRYVRDTRSNVFFKTQANAQQFMAFYRLSPIKYLITDRYVRRITGKRSMPFTRLPKNARSVTK